MTKQLLSAITVWVGAGIVRRSDSRFVPSQWDTALLCKDVTHGLGASLESALVQYFVFYSHSLNTGLRHYKTSGSYRNMNQQYCNQSDVLPPCSHFQMMMDLKLVFQKVIEICAPYYVYGEKAMNPALVRLSPCLGALITDSKAITMPGCINHCPIDSF